MSRPLLLALTLALAAPAHAGDAKEISLPAGATSADAQRRVNAQVGDACQIGEKRWSGLFHKGDTNRDAKLQAGEFGGMSGAINEHYRGGRVGKCKSIKLVTDGR